jgi:hypothetical protein
MCHLCWKSTSLGTYLIHFVVTTHRIAYRYCYPPCFVVENTRGIAILIDEALSDILGGNGVCASRRPRGLRNGARIVTHNVVSGKLKFTDAMGGFMEEGTKCRHYLSQICIASVRTEHSTYLYRQRSFGNVLETTIALFTRVFNHNVRNGHVSAVGWKSNK